uniref:Uncharacterized protein n=1 Tax=Haptolina ericina TaxID=156174 RepID=A0A7S3FM32_9EUKA
MTKLAEALASELGCALTLCTSELKSAAAMCLESFPSGDPNVKLRIEAVRDQHVVLLFDQGPDTNTFEQLSILLFLQRFTVPHALAEYSKDKWKRTITDGAYDVCSAASITVIVPWYRYCQMERTCRWSVVDTKWYNGEPQGEFVDIPTAHTFASLLSSEPAGSRQVSCLYGATHCPDPTSWYRITSSFIGCTAALCFMWSHLLSPLKPSPRASAYCCSQRVLSSCRNSCCW